VSAIVAPTPERAERLARAADLSTVRLRSGRPAPLPSPEEAAEHPWTDAELQVAAASRRLLHVGTPQAVADALRQVAARTGADELMVMTNAHDPAERRASYRLLAQEWGLESVAASQPALAT
jgi:alkanesulfonate monooxygenase SsuD/methylene tetrahydromethanopterin reductase-like flavin-dependent oxidoreductase (luciferase family)